MIDIKEYRRKYYQKNKEKLDRQHREYYQKNMERIKEAKSIWHKNNRDKARESNARWVKNNPQYQIDYHKKWAKKQRELNTPYANRRRMDSVTWHRKIRLQVLEHYGGNPPTCSCCGERQIVFLCIDHIGGGGNKQKRSIRKTLANWIYSNGFPSGFRVLCWNCNSAMGILGSCPHQKMKLGEV